MSANSEVVSYLKYIGNTVYRADHAEGGRQKACQQTQKWKVILL
jgi:hypothetical protein